MYSPQKVETTKQKYITRLQELLNPNNYADEIPDEIVHGQKDGKQYKCQKGWFNCLSGEIWLIKHEKLFQLSPELLKEIDQFENKVIGRLRSPDIYTKDTDITASQKIIYKIIAELERKI